MPGLNSGKSRFLISGNTSGNLSRRFIVSLSVVSAETIWFMDCAYIGLGKEDCIFFLIVFIAGTRIHYCSIKHVFSGGRIETVIVPMYFTAFVSLRAGDPSTTSQSLRVATSMVYSSRYPSQSSWTMT